jgi:hypothetical protein
MLTPIFRGTVSGQTGTTLMARLRGQNGVLVTQGTLLSITYTITNITTGAAVGSGTLVVSTVIFDSLQQNDPRWKQDSAAKPGLDGVWGFNFLAQIPAASFPVSPQSTAGIAAPNPTYQVDCVFTPIAGEPFRVIFQVTADKVYG